jgi:uncharacterized protein
MLSRPTRAAPRWLVYAGLVFPTLVTLVYFVLLAGFPSALQQGAYAAGKALQFGLPAVWCVIVLRERPTEALRSRRGWRLGVAFGLLVLGAMQLLYWLVLEPLGFFEGPGEAIREKIQGMGLASTARYAAVGVFYALAHSALEEYYWRWFVFRHLLSWHAVWPAIAVSSVGFMAHHILVLAQFFGWQHPATYLFSLSVAVGGAFWAWLYHRSGSLVGPWLGHLLVDAGIFLLGYEVARALFTT